MIKLAVVLVSIVGLSSSAAVPKATPCGVKFIPHIEGNGDQKIFGGVEARPNSWPWQISLRKKGYEDVESGGHFCGGTLIADRWVLTAGHCISMPGYRDPRNIRVHAGAHTTYKMDEHEQTRNVSCIHRHYLWTMINGTLDNDIAILELETPFDLNDYVAVTCLPPQNLELNHGDMCYATGWGATVDYLVEDAVVSTVMKQTLLPVWDHKTCKRVTLLHLFLLTENMICTGYEEGGHGTCKGDSGGPLHCEVNGVWNVLGATSWGFGCGRPNNPGVFTKVSKYRDWIDTVMAESTGISGDYGIFKSRCDDGTK